MAIKLRRQYCAFTLIELLVVTSIIGVLIAVILPALGSARSSARTVACLSNLKQLGYWTEIYLQDNDDQMLPRYSAEGRVWVNYLREAFPDMPNAGSGYIGGLHCPEVEQGISFGYNIKISKVKRDQVPAPHTNMPIYFDATTNEVYSSSQFVYRHPNQSINVVYLDSHAATTTSEASPVLGPYLP